MAIWLIYTMDAPHLLPFCSGIRALPREDPRPGHCWIEVMSYYWNGCGIVSVQESTETASWSVVHLVISKQSALWTLTSGPLHSGISGYQPGDLDGILVDHLQEVACLLDYGYGCGCGPCSGCGDALDWGKCSYFDFFCSCTYVKDSFRVIPKAYGCLERKK